jgi:hypothetical protein
MRTTLLLLVCAQPASAFKLEYVDFLGPEIVGELQPRAYDLKIDDKFVGVTRLHPGTLVLGGIGLRYVGREPSGNSNGGVRISFEVSGEWGRFQDSPFSTVSRAEVLGGVGYEGTLGILVLHTATILGIDYQTFDLGKNQSVDMVALRAGQQVGAHLQIASCVALYADGTIDWDGQWRVRAGISVGELLRKPKSSPVPKGVLAPRAP